MAPPLADCDKLMAGSGTTVRRPSAPAARAVVLATMVLLVGSAGVAAAAGSAPICLQPLGDAKRGDVARIKVGIATVYGLRARVLRRVDAPTNAWCNDKLCDPEGLVRKFHNPAFQRCERVLVVTTSPLLGRFGRAMGAGEPPVVRNWYGNLVALLSTDDLDKVGPRRTRQLILVAIHELGHTFGLDHCPRRRCIMWREHEGAAAQDMAPLDFCPRCRAALRSAGHQAYRGPFTFWPKQRFLTRAQRHALRQARLQPTPATRKLLQRLRACDKDCTEATLGRSADVFLAP